MKFLLIDVGNTRLKWAVCDARAGRAMLAADGRDHWLARGECPTRSLRDSGKAVRTLAEAWTALGQDSDLAAASYCSVAGGGVDARVEALASHCGVRGLRRFESRAAVSILRNGYASPSQLGADRLAAALGATLRVPADLVVVCAGTATTVDIVRREAPDSALFQGGLILPGLDLMMTALARNTAGLPQARGTFQEAPDNTEDAITSGCLQAQAGAIERMRAVLGADAPCVAAGGAAARIIPLLAEPVIHAPDLVLEGLAAAILPR